jgi:hypothetical protein
VLVEREKALRNLGKQTIAERERWLYTVAVIKDDGS